MTEAITVVIRQALDDDAWDGHDQPLTPADLDRIAETAAAAAHQVFAELLAPAKALVDRWEAEASTRGPDDRLVTSGVVAMLRETLPAIAPVSDR